MSETLDKILKHWICTFPETEQCDTESSMRAICKAFLAHKKAEGEGDE